MKALRAVALLLCLMMLLNACAPQAGDQSTTAPETPTQESTAADTTGPDDNNTNTTGPDDSNTTGPDDSNTGTTGPDNTGSGTIAQKPMASVSMPITTDSPTTASDGTVVFKYTQQYSIDLFL